MNAPGRPATTAGRLGAVLASALLFAGCAALPIERLPEPDVRDPEPRARRDLPPQLPPRPPEGTREQPSAPLPTPVPQPSPDPVPGYHPASEALVEQARREALLGEDARAGATLERALRIDANNPWIWIELGHLRLDAGHTAAAESMARKALSLSSRDSEAREAAGRLLQQAGGGGR